MHLLTWAEVDAAVSPIVCRAVDYPVQTVSRPHSHNRAQLLFGAAGLMRVSTAHGSWVVPPGQGVWIPPHVVHDVWMLEPVSTRNIYIHKDYLEGLPASCEVVEITPLVRELLMQTGELPPVYAPDSRPGAIMTLLLHELRRLRTLPLGLPFPTDPALAARCHAFLAEPSVHVTIEQWCDAMAVSRRAFTRMFRREVGMSFRRWCQQACLFTALPRLSAGESVTTIALDLGYESPAAFSTMFKRALGIVPSRYLQAA